MSTRIGIVGLPNAGKSSLFNALTKAGVEAANYPFTTIEPNVAVVPVLDERLVEVARTVGASEIVWDTIDFHDIAGLVAGAHKGEGLGNRFLANIRETDAIVHVVRAHSDENVVHPEGRVDPLADIETIETELVLADLEQAERRVDRVAKQAKGGDRVAIAEEAWLREVIGELQSGRPARGVPAPEEAPHALRDLGALTAKPVLFVVNVDEGSEEVPAAVADHAAAEGAGVVAVSSRIESELAELEEEEAALMRAELGVTRIEPAAGRARGLLAAAPDRVLHRRRGQAGPVLAPARRPHRLARRRPDPQRHPEGLRARRSGRLARARRRRRLRGRPRARHPAPGGPRLRDARRRHDHRQVHARSARGRCAQAASSAARVLSHAMRVAWASISAWLGIDVGAGRESLGQALHAHLPRLRRAAREIGGRVRLGAPPPSPRASRSA